MEKHKNSCQGSVVRGQKTGNPYSDSRIAERLNYIDANQLKKLLDNTAEVGRTLNGLRKSLEKSSS